MTVCNASGFSVSKGGPKSAIYSSQGPSKVQNLVEALDPSSWRDCFDPFAHVFVDNESQEKVLVRDHLGVAPLYYSVREGTLIFGDNLPDILRHFPQSPGLLDRQVHGLFSNSQEYSDETFYKNIYRVEPGHLIHIKANGVIEKKVFWQLSREGKALVYKDDREYLEHFSELLSEAIHHSTKGAANLAAEFSAGIDSTAVYLAAKSNGFEPKLYMHAALPGSDSENIYNKHQEKIFLETFPNTPLTRVVAEDYDPFADFKTSAEWFGGPAPYIFFLFVHPLYRTVQAGQHSTLLSGFGGDQGVSGLAPLHFLLPSLLNEKRYLEAWRELGTRHPIKKVWECAKHSNATMYEAIKALKNTGLTLRNQQTLHTYHRKYFRTLREAEWNFLQGPYSHEVRMRIEYSSVMSKKFGFQYRYPLLYPKLLEFYLSIPAEQKRRNENGRYLIRRYLAKHLPSEVFDSYKKRTGLGILPGTFSVFKKNYEAGSYRNEFSSLPYPELVHSKLEAIRMRNSIKAYMVKLAPTSLSF